MTSVENTLSILSQIRSGLTTANAAQNLVAAESSTARDIYLHAETAARTTNLHVVKRSEGSPNIRYRSASELAFLFRSGLPPVLPVKYAAVLPQNWKLLSQGMDKVHHKLLAAGADTEWKLGSFEEGILILSLLVQREKLLDEYCLCKNKETGHFYIVKGSARRVFTPFPVEGMTLHNHPSGCENPSLPDLLRLKINETLSSVILTRHSNGSLWITRFFIAGPFIGQEVYCIPPTQMDGGLGVLKYFWGMGEPEGYYFFGVRNKTSWIPQAHPQGIFANNSGPSPLITLAKKVHPNPRMTALEAAPNLLESLPVALELLQLYLKGGYGIEAIVLVRRIRECYPDAKLGREILRIKHLLPLYWHSIDDILQVPIF